MSESRYYLHSVGNALRVLESFSPHAPELSATELSERLGLSKAATHRLLFTLQSRGFIERDESTRRYRVGLKVFEIGSLVLRVTGFGILVQPEMVELARLCNETVNIGVLSRSKVMYLSKIESRGEILGLDLEVGQRVHAHCTALGKILLAYLPSKEVNDILAKEGLPRLTPKTIVDAKEFREHLEQVRHQGFAVDDEEFRFGIRCIAVPIRNRSGDVIAAISVAGPSDRFTLERVHEYKDAVITTGQRISDRLSIVGGP